jgi:FkbM family methyltransferase
MTTDFQDCFQKHSFNELNDIDVNIFIRVLNPLIHRFKNPPVIFDVGCNAGSFVKVLKMFNIIENIHCFEPHPVINVKTKEVYPYIKMNPYCLGNVDGNINIYIPQWSVGLTSIVDRPVFKELNQKITTVNVKCEKLDTYCELNDIDTISFIKIDVEGGEKTIFEGAKRMLENKKILSGMFEIGQTLYDYGTHEKEISEMLEGYGYTIDKSIRDNYVFYLK